jgi:hypothetical protein
MELGHEVGANRNRPHEVDFKSPTWSPNSDLNFTEFPISEVGVLGSWGELRSSWGRVGGRV